MTLLASATASWQAIPAAHRPSNEGGVTLLSHSLFILAPYRAIFHLKNWSCDMNTKHALAILVSIFSLCALDGPASATTILNSYRMGTINPQVSDSSDGSIHADWSYGTLAASVDIVTRDGYGSIAGTATGNKSTFAFINPTSSWSDTYIISGPGDNSVGNITIFGTLDASTLGQSVTNDAQIRFYLTVENLTAYRGGRSGSAVWNPGFVGGSFSQATEANLDVANGDVIRVTGSVSEWGAAQSPATMDASPTTSYTQFATAQVTGIQISSGYSFLSPVPEPLAIWLAIAGIGILVISRHRHQI